MQQSRERESFRFSDIIVSRDTDIAAERYYYNTRINTPHTHEHILIIIIKQDIPHRQCQAPCMLIIVSLYCNRSFLRLEEESHLSNLLKDELG